MSSSLPGPSNGAIDERQPLLPQTVAPVPPGEAPEVPGLPSDDENGVDAKAGWAGVIWKTVLGLLVLLFVLILVQGWNDADVEVCATGSFFRAFLWASQARPD